jgi:two-component sensor histidine kinase
LKNIQFSNYLNDLANDLIRVYGQQKEITISIDTQVEQIGMRSIVPLGLLFNELISNSLKYAFNEKPTGQITIQLRKNDNNYTIEYTDDGNWVEREEYRGFGLSLIETLTEQLDGSKILTTLPNKTHYIFELKQLDL